MAMQLEEVEKLNELVEAEEVKLVMQMNIGLDKEGVEGSEILLGTAGLDGSQADL